MRVDLRDPWDLVDAVDAAMNAAMNAADTADTPSTLETQPTTTVLVAVAPPAPPAIEAQQRTLLLYLTARTIEDDLRVHILRPRGTAPGLDERVDAAVAGLERLSAARGLDLEIR